MTADWVGKLLWTTTLDALTSEREQLDSLLTEEFIWRYAAADDRLIEFDRQDDPTVEIVPEED